MCTDTIDPQQWLKSRAPALSQREHSRLARAYSSTFSGKPESYYAFVHRTCKEYKAFMIANNGLVDDLHSKRDSLIAAAVSQVLCQIPAIDKPHAGDVNSAKEAIIDLVETVFDMPHAGFSFGSPGWIKEQCANPRDIEFHHAVKFPKLLHRLVKHLMKTGGDHGFPLVQPGEHIPHQGVYAAHKRAGRAKGSTKFHKNLMFLNVSSVSKAITALKNLGLYPLRCMGAAMPGGKEWNNFAEVLYTFWIFYCYYEAIDRTLDLARPVLLYIFFALLVGPRGKKWPVVRYMHPPFSNQRQASLCFHDVVTLWRALPVTGRTSQLGHLPYRRRQGQASC